MTRQEVFENVVAIVRRYARANVEHVQPSTSLLQDLRVNSARLVDIILDMEDLFGITIDDESADKARTIGDVVEFVLAQSGVSAAG